MKLVFGLVVLGALAACGTGAAARPSIVAILTDDAHPEKAQELFRLHEEWLKEMVRSAPKAKAGEKPRDRKAERMKERAGR